MQVLFLGRAPRTKETLPDFLKWRRVTRPPLVFRRLTGSERTPGFWGVTYHIVPEVRFSIYIIVHWVCHGVVRLVSSNGYALGLPRYREVGFIQR